jgi:hypothetical protein
VILTLLPTAFQFLSNYKTLASGVLLVTAMLYLPQGLYGGLIKLLNQLPGGKPRHPAMTPLPVEASQHG